MSRRCTCTFHQGLHVLSILAHLSLFLLFLAATSKAVRLDFSTPSGLQAIHTPGPMILLAAPLRCLEILKHGWCLKEHFLVKLHAPQQILRVRSALELYSGDWGINSNIASNATVSVLELPGNAMPQVWFKASIPTTLTAILLRKCGDLMLVAYIPRIGWRKTLQKKPMEAFHLAKNNDLPWVFPCFPYFPLAIGTWRAACEALTLRGGCRLPNFCGSCSGNAWRCGKSNWHTNLCHFRHRPVLAVLCGWFAVNQSAWKKTWGLGSGSGETPRSPWL